MSLTNDDPSAFIAVYAKEKAKKSRVKLSHVKLSRVKLSRVFGAISEGRVDERLSFKKPQAQSHVTKLL